MPGGDSEPTHVADEPARKPDRRRRPLRWLLAIVVAVALLAVGLKIGTGLDDARSVASPLLGKPAPSFSLPRLDGGTLRSADWHGRVYVVNFWASWCAPCRAEAPILQSFYERRSPRVELVGIVVNDTAENASAFRDEFRLTYPQVEDPGGAVRDQYDVHGVPETYLVDADGAVRGAILGRIRRGTLEDALRDIERGRQVSVAPRT